MEGIPTPLPRAWRDRSVSSSDLTGKSLPSPSSWHSPGLGGRGNVSSGGQGGRKSAPDLDAHGPREARQAREGDDRVG